MTRRFLAVWLLVALCGASGCKAKQDAGMRPVSDASSSSSAAQSLPQPGSEDAAPTLDAPPIEWPAGEQAPPQFDSAMPLSADAGPTSATDGGMELPPPSANLRTMAAPSHAAPPEGVPFAPADTANADASSTVTSRSVAPRETAAPIAPRMAIRATAPQTADPSYEVVPVFYGTDRLRLNPTAPNVGDYIRHYRGAAGALAASLVLAGALLLGSKRWPAVAVGTVGLLAAAAMAILATTQVVHAKHVVRNELVQYGDGRGELEMGLCRVSIPHDHRVGAVESPSVLRLEFHEDPEKHVAILDAKEYAADEFFGQMQAAWAGASRRELLVFVHGYNVTFDDAVRRTAQIAYDLKFGGAAVCYSWPSNGALLAYTADENNVQWTVPHLIEFLTRLRKDSGAKAINLVAHSMGTRALTDALREFARDAAEHETPFNQVVLAAPDIDAEVFRRDLAPALSKTARRATLYASSNDQALAASRKLHAYPRAGESGANLVVEPGLDTIDVSAIDTSLLGHSYYGDNDSIISDLYHVVHEALPPAQRARLQAAALRGIPYWVFTPAAAARMARPDGSPPQ